MITVKHNDAIGVTVGRRDNGSRFIQWSDNSITMHSAEEFNNMLWLSEVSVLAEGVQS